MQHFRWKINKTTIISFHILYWTSFRQFQTEYFLCALLKRWTESNKMWVNVFRKTSIAKTSPCTYVWHYITFQTESFKSKKKRKFLFEFNIAKCENNASIRSYTNHITIKNEHERERNRKCNQTLPKWMFSLDWSEFTKSDRINFVLIQWYYPFLFYYFDIAECITIDLRFILDALHISIPFSFFISFTVATASWFVFPFVFPIAHMLRANVFRFIQRNFTQLKIEFDDRVQHKLKSLMHTQFSRNDDKVLLWLKIRLDSFFSLSLSLFTSHSHRIFDRVSFWIVFMHYMFHVPRALIVFVCFSLSITLDLPP